MLEKDIAICIRKTDYSETSQIITLLTRKFGKISAIAKGSRNSKNKSFGSKIELFSCGEIVFSPSKTSSLATLTEFDQRPVFVGISRGLYKLNCAMFGAELVHSLTEEHDPHASLFDLLYDFLANVQVCSSRLESLVLLIGFQLDLLEELGIALVFSHCTNCGYAFSLDWQGAWFCSENNGVVCRDCEAAFIDKIRVEVSVVEALGDNDKLKEQELEALDYIEKLLIRHFSFILNKTPRMARFFIRN